MINIICGKKNRGKTAKIESIYAEEKQGDGFITRKIFRGPTFCGYKITRLSTGESMAQSLKSELFPSGEVPLYTRGPFAFFREGFAFADQIINEIILNRTSPVFIDEIGPLELQGKGHHECFKKIIQTERTIYFTVRDWCLDEVISFYSMRKYSIIRV